MAGIARPRTALLAIALLAAVGMGTLFVRQALQPGAADAKVLRDFHGDQQALFVALSQGDPAPLAGHWTGNALQDAEQDVRQGSATRTLDEQSVEVLHAGDPNDPTVTTEVHQVAVLTNTTTSADGQQHTVGPETLDGRYWLREVDGVWAITDLTQAVSPAPSGPPTWVLLLAVTVVGAAIAAVATARVRARARAPAPSPESGDRAREDADRRAEPATILVPATEEATLESRLRVQLCGRLAVSHEGQDLTAQLRDRPTASFVWLLLLVEALLGGKFDRAQLAEETYPGLDPETQRRRLRNLLSSLRRDLAPALVEVLDLDKSAVRLRLGDCHVDVLDLLRLAAQCGPGAVLPDSRLPEAENMLAATAPEPLPFWDGLVEQVTGDRGIATHRVVALREELRRGRALVQMAVAEAHLQAGRAEAAVELLKGAHEAQPEREEIAQRLARAYRLAGREADAKELLRHYS